MDSPAENGGETNGIAADIPNSPLTSQWGDGNWQADWEQDSPSDWMQSTFTELNNWGYPEPIPTSPSGPPITTPFVVDPDAWFDFDADETPAFNMRDPKHWQPGGVCYDRFPWWMQGDSPEKYVAT